MKKEPPSWAFEAPAPGDFERVREAHRAGRAVVSLPEPGALRAWAKVQGWALSRWKFEAAFLFQLREWAN